MTEAVVIMGGLGVVIGICLAFASKIFYVYVDPKILAVEDALPGANCGGCGLPGCSANAEAIVKGDAAPNSCVAAGPEVAEAIAAIMGMTIEAKEPDIARPGCYFGVADADLKFHYNGVNDCRAAALLGGGMKVCAIGCMGLGSCVRACPFDALSMGPDGIPVVDEVKCTGCGTCERVCPKHIINLSSVTRRILKEYTTEECTTPCQRECPAGIDIREYIRQISLGDYRRSVQVIKERNPFPAVIGRICPRPCENACRRGLTDAPVAINYLKRFAADFERDGGDRVQPYKAPDTGRKVAVIGGGVEGLSAAFFSARLGHEAAVFEATDKLGGLLRTAISAYRLPADILDWDIEGVLEMGVTAETGKALGKDFTVASLLKEGYDAVYTATGGWDSRLTRVNADDIEETIPGTYLLMDLILGDSDTSHKIFINDHVVIAGGGKLALEGAGICRDLGAENVTVLFREPRVFSPVDSDALAEAGERGVNVVFNAAVTRLFGSENRLEALTCADLETLEEQRLTVQNLFFATGRMPELVFMKERETVEEAAEATEETAETADAAEMEIKEKEAPAAAEAESGDEAAAVTQGPLRWEAVPAYKKPECADQVGLFAEGEALTDFSAAIRAIGAGRRGAASIHQAMYDLPVALPENVVTPDAMIQNVDHVEGVSEKPREIMPLCGGKELDACGVLELGFDEAQAQKEAARCLQCGLICYERN